MSDQDMSSDRPPAIPDDQREGRRQAEAGPFSSMAVTLPINAIGETGGLEISGSPSSKTLRIVTTGGTVIVIPLGNGDFSIAITGGTDTGELGLFVELAEPARSPLRPVPSPAADKAAEQPEKPHDQ